MEQLSTHLGNAKFVSILIDAPNHKKKYQTTSDCSVLKNLRGENIICNSPAPSTQSIAPGVSGRPWGRRQRQPAPAAEAQPGTALAGTAQPPGRAEGPEGRKIRQGEARGREVQGRRAVMVGFWESKLFARSRVANTAVGQGPVSLGHRPRAEPSVSLTGHLGK